MKNMSTSLLLPGATKSRADTLKKLNVGAGVFHGINFIVALVLIILYSNQSLSTSITTDFNATIDVLGDYKVIWVELPFSAITSVFHLGLAWLPEQTTHYNEYVLLKGYSPYRWIEYAITASLMTWVVLQVAGVTNVVVLVLAGIICNMVLQYQGYLMEVLNPNKRARINWGPTWAGWILFVGQWALIWTYFGSTVSQGAPWYVYAIVIGMFVQYCFFGMVQLVQFTGFMDSYGAERAYIILSYTSKCFQLYVLVIAMLTSPAT